MSMWRKLVLLIVLLWLPLQGFAAAAMPFCGHALMGGGAAQMTPQHEGHHQHGPSGNAPRASHHHNGALAASSCNDCGACHLACAPMVPCKSVEIAPVVAHTFGVSLPISLSPFIPERPTPPPLSVIV